MLRIIAIRPWSRAWLALRQQPGLKDFQPRQPPDTFIIDSNEPSHHRQLRPNIPPTSGSYRASSRTTSFTTTSHSHGVTFGFIAGPATVPSATALAAGSTPKPRAGGPTSHLRAAFCSASHRATDPRLGRQPHFIMYDDGSVPEQQVHGGSGRYLSPLWTSSTDEEGADRFGP